MEHTTSKKFTTIVNEKDNSPSGNTYLVERDEVENTPFMIITINNESFGVLGKYRITEVYHTKEECRVELLNITWNRIIQVIQLMHIINKENQTETN